MQAADLIQSIYSNVPILISYYAEIKKKNYALSGEKKSLKFANVFHTTFLRKCKKN